MGLGALPDYMQGTMSPEEFLRASREQGMNDFNINNPAPPGTLGTLSSRSLFGGNTGQNGPLVSAVNKYNYAQRDAYQRAMLTGTQQAHAMNLQNTQQAQQMLNDNRNFGLNRQNMLGNQYLRAQELQNQSNNEQARLGLDTRVHGDMMPLRQQQSNTEAARQRAEEQMGLGRLALDTQVHGDMQPLRQQQANTDTARQQAEERLGGRRIDVDQGRLSFDERAHNELMPLRRQETDTSAARQISDAKLGAGRLALDTTAQSDSTDLNRGRLDLDSYAAMRRANTEEMQQQAAAGVGYLNARSTAQQANTEATRVTNEGRIGEGQLGVNQQQANTQQAASQATAYNENQRNVASFADIASRRKIGVADLEERARHRNMEYFLGLQQALNNQQDIVNRNQQEANKLQLEKQHYALSSKVANLNHLATQRNLDHTELKDLLSYQTKLRELDNQKARIQADVSIAGDSNKILQEKTQAELTARKLELMLGREKQAVEGTLGARRLAADLTKINDEKSLGGRALNLKERQQNLEMKARLGDQLLRTQEIAASDRATKSMAQQNEARVEQAKMDTLSRQAIGHESNSIEAIKAKMRDKVEREGLDYKKVFDRENFDIMRSKLGIQEDQLRAYQQDIANRNYHGVRAFQLKLSSANFNRVENTVSMMMKRAGQLMAASASERDHRVALAKQRTAETLAANALRLGLGHLQEQASSRIDNNYFRALDASQTAENEDNRHFEHMQGLLKDWKLLDLEAEVARNNTEFRTAGLGLKREQFKSDADYRKAKAEADEAYREKVLQTSIERHNAELQASLTASKTGYEKAAEARQEAYDHDTKAREARYAQEDKVRKDEQDHEDKTRTTAYEKSKETREAQQKHEAEMEKIAQRKADRRQKRANKFAAMENKASRELTESIARANNEHQLYMAKWNALTEDERERRRQSHENKVNAWQSTINGLYALGGAYTRVRSDTK